MPGEILPGSELGTEGLVSLLKVLTTRGRRMERERATKQIISKKICNLPGIFLYLSVYATVGTMFKRNYNYYSFLILILPMIAAKTNPKAIRVASIVNMATRYRFQNGQDGLEGW
jgi:hypothetical protein